MASRGARHVEGDHVLFAEQSIDESALADIGPPGHGHAWPVVCVFVFGFAGERRQRFLDQFTHAVAMGRGNHQRRAAAEFVELRGNHRSIHPLAFVDHQQQRLTGLAQTVGNDPVLRCHRRAR